MKRLLLVTPLDVARQPNNRDHHIIRHIASRFDEAAVVFRKRVERRGGFGFLADLLIPRFRASTDDSGVRYFEVNPLFNHYQGLSMDISGTYEMDGAAQGASGWRHRVYRLTSGLGLVKDASTVLFLLLCVLLRTRGRFEVGIGMGPHGSAVVRLLKKMGKVTVWSYEDRDYEAGFFPTPIRHRVTAHLESTGLALADVSACSSYRLAAFRERQVGKRIEVITNGVDLSRYALRARAVSPPILVYTGNVTFWSGLDMVIAAMPAIRAAAPEARLHVVGPGLAGYVEGLRRTIASLKLDDSVEFLGRVDNVRVPEILAEARLGIAVFRPMPLRDYAFPLKVLEYMAAGLPVIGTKGTETEDILRRHECGIAVEYDPAAFASAALALLSDPALYGRLADNARASSRIYDWSTLMDRDFDQIHDALALAEGRREKT